jgi:hypothetical protein
MIDVETGEKIAAVEIRKRGASRAKAAKGKQSTAKDCGNVSPTKSERNRNPKKKAAGSTRAKANSEVIAPKKRNPKQAPTSQPVAGSDPDAAIATSLTDLVAIIAPPRITFGKHRGKTWQDVPREYLQWMVDNGHTAVADARAELSRRDAPPPIAIVIAPAAIDEASLKLRDYWDANRGTWEGLHSWLTKLATEAFRSVDFWRALEADSPVEFRGILFEFSANVNGAINLDAIRNPKAGIAWRSDTRAGMDRAAYADRQRDTGRGVW